MIHSYNAPTDHPHVAIPSHQRCRRFPKKKSIYLSKSTARNVSIAYDRISSCPRTDWAMISSTFFTSLAVHFAALHELTICTKSNKCINNDNAIYDHKLGFTCVLRSQSWVGWNK